jgi:hypothetical protein
MSGKWEWDDVRYSLAASREGSLSGAARSIHSGGGMKDLEFGRRFYLPAMIGR